MTEHTKKDDLEMLRLETAILLGCAIDGLEEGVEDCRAQALRYHERSTHFTNMAAALTLRLREYQEKLAALRLEQKRADESEQQNEQRQEQERIATTRLRVPPASFWNPAAFWKRPARNEE